MIIIERVAMRAIFDEKIISLNIFDDKVNLICSEYLDVDESIAEQFDEDRKDKLKRIKSETKRSELYTSGVLIESIKPEGAEVKYTEYDKPYFVRKSCKGISNNDEERIFPYFNITHSNGKVFCVWSDTFEVGVDYEVSFREIKPSLTKKLCTKKELDFYEQFESKTEADKWLLRLFTRKEAVSKLIGKGLLIDFKNIEEYSDNTELLNDTSKMIYRNENDEKIFEVLSDEIYDGTLSIAINQNIMNNNTLHLVIG